MISERLRFEAWMGSSGGVVVPGVAGEPASPKTEICRLEGRDYTKMLRRNSDLKGFFAHSGGLSDVCNFATHSGKTMRRGAENHSFNCALEGGR